MTTKHQIRFFILSVAIVLCVSSASVVSLAGWTPADITTALWLDAADGSTVLTSGSSVTNWLDKSGNNRRVMQGNASYQPVSGTRTINGLNAIDFPDNDALQTASIATWLNGTKFHIIAVLQHDAEGMYAGTDGSGGNKILHIGQSGSNWRHAHFSNDAGWPHDLDMTPLIAVNSFNNTGSDAWINGTSLGATAANPNAALATDGPLSIGRPSGIYFPGNLGYYDGTIGEIVCVTGDLSTDDRQKLEGYLAKKWGLDDKLPKGHPGKIPDGTIIVIR